MAIRYTYLDEDATGAGSEGATEVIGSTGGQSWAKDEGTGHTLATAAVPPAENVMKLDFYNDASSSENYGRDI